MYTVSLTGNCMSLFPELRTHEMSLFAQPMEQTERKIVFRKYSTVIVMKKGTKVLLFS